MTGIVGSCQVAPQGSLTPSPERGVENGRQGADFVQIRRLVVLPEDAFRVGRGRRPSEKSPREAVSAAI